MFAPLIRIQMLGAFNVQQGERQITRFRYQKAAALLAYLAFNRTRMHSREELIERMWPEFSPDAGRNNLSNILSSLRHQLEPPGTPTGTVLIADRSSVGLRAGAVATDVAEYETYLRSADRSDSSTRQIQCLSDALSLYTGPLLTGFYDEWIGPAALRLSESFLQAARRLVRLLAAAGDADRAIEIARRAVNMDPVREESNRDLMQLYIALGQPSAALRQYRVLEGILQGYGESPSLATRRIAAELKDRQAVSMTHPADPAVVISEPIREQGSSSVGDGEHVAHPEQRLMQPAAAMPSGTVTLLLVDRSQVVNSEPTANRDLWKRQADLLRQVFARWAGHVFQAKGQNFAVAFQSTADALACALDALIELDKGVEIDSMPACETDIGASSPSAVIPLSPQAPRLALHSGDVKPKGTRYSGSVFQRAQRIVGAGHGGQLLCSEATAALLSRELDQGIRLLDLGLYRLSPGAEMERIWQVAADGAEPFPPLRAKSVMGIQLPPQLTRFFGREAEIARLLQLLQPPTHSAGAHSAPLRLLTLTGSGGMGKTRLAMEAAMRLAEPWEGAVWFVPLADVNDPMVIPSALVSAMGLRRSSETDPMEQVIVELNSRPSLIILDNFEHLVDTGTSTVLTLLERVPFLTCLVTSRQRLEIAGEHEIVIAPLPVPAMRDDEKIEHQSSPATLLAYESVQLFVDRAQLVSPDFQLNVNNSDAVATLCAGLEGIPLALELAASRAQVLTPAQMLEQLWNRFTFLVTRRRDTAARHRTLLATVEWSYRLLTPELRQIFARLSVFRGGWDLDAAEAICEDLRFSALDALAQLRECSLVLADQGSGTIRFRMLETLREFAALQVTQDEGELINRRHADHYCWRVTSARLGRTTDIRSFARLEEDLDNIRAVLAGSLKEGVDIETGMRAASELYYFFLVRGHISEGRRWFASFIGRSPDEHSTMLAKILYGAGVLATKQGDFPDAFDLLSRCLTIAQALNHNELLASTYNELGTAAYSQGDCAQARYFYEKHLTLAREQGRPLFVASALGNLANVAQSAGDFDSCCALNAESLGIWQSEGDRRGQAITLHNMASLAHFRGRLADAHSYYEQSLEIKRGLADRNSIIYSLVGIALVEKEQQHYLTAAANLREALGMARALTIRVHLVDILYALVGLVQAAGSCDVAARLYGTMERVREEMRYPLQPIPQQEYDANLSVLRELLGETVFVSLHSEGRNLTLEQGLSCVEQTLTFCSL